MKINFNDIKLSLKNKPREWYRARGIPAEKCESIWDHSNRTKQACKALITGTPNRVFDKEGFLLMWWGHDFIEWDIPDITPNCPYTSQEKKKIEKESLIRLEKGLWDEYKWIIMKIREYQSWETSDSRELFYIDKSLAWVGALEYERQWFPNMSDFHEYALEKLAWDMYHTQIYNSLLKREFSTVDFFTQYFLLLQMAWNYKKFSNLLNKQS